VDDRRRPLLGDPRREPLVDRVDDRELAGLRLLPLTVPTPQLAGDVVLLAPQVAETDVVGADRVDLDQSVDDPLADRAPPGLVGEELGVAPRPQDRPLENGAPFVVSSSQRPTTGGTGTGVSLSAAITLCSRLMSWAEPSRLPSGGRRSAQRRPFASLTA